MTLLFWFSFLAIFYTYFGYPILLFMVSKMVYKPVRKKASEPFVSIIISAFNEEKAIEKKLLNVSLGTRSVSAAWLSFLSLRAKQSLRN